MNGFLGVVAGASVGASVVLCDVCLKMNGFCRRSRGRTGRLPPGTNGGR